MPPQEPPVAARKLVSLGQWVGEREGGRAKIRTGLAFSRIGYLRNRSPIACFMTAPPTSEIDFVSGMSLGQTSTQF